VRDINDSIQQITLNVHKDKAVKIINANGSVANFIMIGKGTKKMKTGITSINPLEMMMGMTKREQKAILTLSSTMRWLYDEVTGQTYQDGISYIPSSHWETDAEAQSFRKGMKLLKEKGLAIKLNRTQYMVNPVMIMVSEQVAAIRQWNQSCEPEHKIVRES